MKKQIVIMGLCFYLASCRSAEPIIFIIEETPSAIPTSSVDTKPLTPQIEIEKAETPQPSSPQIGETPWPALTPWPANTPWPESSPWPATTPWPAPTTQNLIQASPPEAPLVQALKTDPTPLYSPGVITTVLHEAPSYNPGDTQLNKIFLQENKRVLYQPGQKVVLHGEPITIPHLNLTPCCIGADDQLIIKVNGTTVLYFLYVTTAVPLLLPDAIDITAFMKAGENQVTVEASNTRAPRSWVPALSLKSYTPAPRYTNPLGMQFGYLLPGHINMGSLQGASHQGYYLQLTEVTQKQWWQVMGAWPDVPPDLEHGLGDDKPMYNISWEDIQVFLSRLNATEEGEYRLPTEAEWEYAARGGKQTTWSCGASASCLKDHAWYETSSVQTVAQKLPVYWPLENITFFDMNGNVAEWTQDWYGEYQASNPINSQGPETGSQRVIRGGNIESTPQTLRIDARDKAAPDTRSPVIGFRMVWDPKGR